MFAQLNAPLSIIAHNLPAISHFFRLRKRAPACPRHRAHKHPLTDYRIRNEPNAPNYHVQIPALPTHHLEEGNPDAVIQVGIPPSELLGCKSRIKP